MLQKLINQLDQWQLLRHCHAHFDYMPYLAEYVFQWPLLGRGRAHGTRL